MEQNLKAIHWNVTTRCQYLGTIGWAFTPTDRSISEGLFWLSLNGLTLASRIKYVFWVIQGGYYPILAIVGVPVNVVTIFVLINKDCGLSACISRYLAAMAVADLLVVILDVILRHIPIVYQEQFYFRKSIPICNIHAALLYTATDCSVWFTVTFTFDRFVAICSQKLKIYFSEQQSP
ncbi:probable G-protein coupled receptor 139 [Stegostoma tigrinum]|uniref:probable G-protein coupled receptor 139 n=1 Tax=Stegostoma tigrinum TaxID=3053191 RepID=UPI0028709EA5|nr:probable G-protein coupled receptor 139 [Stegostoma tigrinum]